MKRRKSVEYNEISNITEPPTRFSDLSPDKQERVQTIIAMKRRGVTNTVIAKLLHISEATLYREMKDLRQMYITRAKSLSMAEELGHGLELFDEIIDRAMEGVRASLEDSEQTVQSVSESGEKRITTKAAPDHNQANRYLMTAASAKRHKLELLIEVGTSQMINQAMQDKSDPYKINVAELKTPEQMRAAEALLEKETIEVGRKLHYYNGPNAMEYKDHSQYEKDMSLHMQQYDKYLVMKQKLLRPFHKNEQPSETI